MTRNANAAPFGDVAFVVRGTRYGRRSARSELDVVLLAAAVEHPVRLYFVGSGIWQIVAGGDPASARLPSGYRAWASITELTRVAAFAEPERLDWLAARGYRTVLPVDPMPSARMSAHWRDCVRVLVL